MENGPGGKISRRQAKRLLNALSNLAREASLTGSLEDGAKTGIRQYNSLLDHFVREGAAPQDLFVRLEAEEDGFDQLGVACTLLDAYIEEEESPPVKPQELVVPGDAQELQELRELRDMLRERMPQRP